jgi:hypothetical protein
MAQGERQQQECGLAAAATLVLHSVSFMLPILWVVIMSADRPCFAGPELGDFVTGKELTDVYSLEAPGYKVITLEQ